MCVCVCVCVCVSDYLHLYHIHSSFFYKHTHTHTHTYIYIIKHIFNLSYIFIDSFKILYELLNIWNKWFKKKQHILKNFRSQLELVVSKRLLEEIDPVTRVQTLNEAVFVTHRATTFGKGMKPIILPPAMGKYWGRLVSLTLVCPPV